MNFFYFISFLVLINYSQSIKQDEFSKEYESILGLFEKQDQNKDKKLSITEFINGMQLMLKGYVKFNQNVEYNKIDINHFAKIFLSKKKNKGLVKLKDIEQWIKDDDIINSYNQWINEEVKDKNYNSQDENSFQQIPKQKNRNSDL